MTSKASIVGLIAVCLVLAGAGATTGAETTAAPPVGFHAQLEQLAHALESGDTDAVRRAASVLPDQPRRTGWNAAALAVSDEARRLCDDEQGTTDGDWQRLTAVCRQLLNETNGEPGREPLRKHTLAETRKALTEVLAAPEYHGTTAPSWWQRYGVRVLEALSRWLERIFSTRLGQRAGVVAYYIAMGILVLPLFILAGYLIWRALQSREEAVGIVATRAVTMLESPDVYWHRAQELLQRGELVEALKNFHLALLAGLEKRGLVVHDRTRTNWEYLTQFRQKTPEAALVSSFQSLNLTYDRTVFGAEPCDAVDVQQFASLTGKLLQDLGAREVTGVDQT
jgi:hypothetical protein